MEIEGKDYLVWLHELRIKRWKEEKKSGLSGAEWLKKTTEEVEKILGKRIPKLKTDFAQISTL